MSGGDLPKPDGSVRFGMVRRLLVIQNHSLASAICSVALAFEMARGHDLVVVLDGGHHAKKLSGLLRLPDGVAVACLADAAFDAALRNAEQVEYIAWYHDLGVEKAQRFAAELSAKNRDCRVTLSFVPDGFSNMYWSDSNLTRFTEAFSTHAWFFGPAYIFFAENTTSRQAVSWTDLKIISHRAYLQALVAYGTDEGLRSEVTRLRARLCAEGIERVVFVALRPWCTSFHGGKYDFGEGAPTLFKIYDTVLSQVAVACTSKTLFVFRGDDRHGDVQRDVIARFARHLDVQFHDLTAGLTPAITLEVFIGALFAEPGPDVSRVMVSLDSIAPLPVAALGLPFEFRIGAPQQMLRECGAAEGQLRYISALVERTRSLVHDVAISMVGIAVRERNSDGLVTLVLSRDADAPAPAGAGGSSPVEIP